jgi:hypothetical protein
MASSFDMAIDHFWQAQQAAMASDQLNCVLQMANGLQLFCGAMQESAGSSDSSFRMAIDHFWLAQQAGMASDQLNCVLQMANGLQLFCGALKR